MNKYRQSKWIIVNWVNYVYWCVRYFLITYKYFITNFLNEVEIRRLLNSFNFIGDDDNDRILQNTMLTEADFNVVNDCAVEKEKEQR